MDKIADPNQPQDRGPAAASKRLRMLASIHGGDIERELGRLSAREWLERAMLSFYRFSGQLDSDSYFTRLNTRFVDELAMAKPLNPNPFAEGAAAA